MAQNMSLFCVHLKKCVLCCFGIKYFINVIFRSSRLVVSSVWSSVPLLTFCLLILSITERWILKSLLLWFFCGILFLFFFFCHTACGIFVPFPGIETGPSKMRVKSPTHWTTREFPLLLWIYLFLLWAPISLATYILKFC